MDKIKDYDEDCFELAFDDDIPEDERKYYVKCFPNVDSIYERRLHCTCCNLHIGSAPASETTLRMHPVLRVSHCKKCHTFYNSGEFEKGEDGSELYCRWCGQGGEVYCCSDCAYVFCKKCITLNLSKFLVTDIMNNDNWKCFGCSPKMLWPLRAQHWAHVNYIEKQKKKIFEENSEDDIIYELLNKDTTSCCRHTKKSSKIREVKKKRRRRASSSESSARSTPELKKTDGSAILPALLTPLQRKNEEKQQKRNELDDGIVCTPDILSFLNEQSEENGKSTSASSSKASVSSSKASILSSKASGSSSKTSVSSPKASVSSSPTIPIKSKSPQTGVKKNLVTTKNPPARINPMSQPPPLIIRQYQGASNVLNQVNSNQQNGRRIPAMIRPHPTPASGTPVFHTINGFRIDLNSASQQETFRLPNGKLIQVKKQPAAVTANQSSSTTTNQTSTNRSILPSNIAPRPQQQFTTIRYNVQPVVQNAQHTQLHLQHLQQQQQILNGLTPTQTHIMPNPTVQQTTIRLTAPRPQVQPTVYPNTPFGIARQQLEAQVLAGQEVCQHIIGKLNTLMVSNAYKTAQNYNDLKELHIHLSYLLTYSNGRFKSIQDKSAEEMKKLGFAAEAANVQADKQHNYEAEEDDLEIVEPQTACIELDSDDENETTTVTNVASKNETPSTTKLNNAISSPVIGETVMMVDSDDELEIPIPPPLEEVAEIDIEKDKKLNSTAKICLNKVENVIPEVMKEIQEILKDVEHKSKSNSNSLNGSDRNGEESIGSNNDNNSKNLGTSENVQKEDYLVVEKGRKRSRDNDSANENEQTKRKKEGTPNKEVDNAIKEGGEETKKNKEADSEKEIEESENESEQSKKKKEATPEKEIANSDEDDQSKKKKVETPEKEIESLDNEGEQKNGRLETTPEKEKIVENTFSKQIKECSVVLVDTPQKANDENDGNNKENSDETVDNEDEDGILSTEETSKTEEIINDIEMVKSNDINDKSQNDDDLKEIICETDPLAETDPLNGFNESDISSDKSNNSEKEFEDEIDALPKSSTILNGNTDIDEEMEEELLADNDTDGLENISSPENFDDIRRDSLDE